MNKKKFQFSNVVMVDGGYIGCIVKGWDASRHKEAQYDVYVRASNCVKRYNESDIKHFVYE